MKENIIDPDLLELSLLFGQIGQKRKLERLIFSFFLGPIRANSRISEKFKDKLINNKHVI